MDSNNELPPNLTPAVVGFIGTIIVTLGYIIETVGEGMELAQITQEEETIAREKEVQNEQLSQIQTKLDYLVKEIEELKKRGDGAPSHKWI